MLRHLLVAAPAPKAQMGRSYNAAVIAVSVVAAIAVFALLLVAIYYLHVRRKMRGSTPAQPNNVSQDFQKSATQSMLGAIHTSPPGVQIFTFKQLQFATNNFNSANILGHGGFGAVYKGILPDGRLTAVKQMEKNGRHADEDFQMEIDLLNRLHSPYLLELIGFCTEQDHRLLVYEFMSKGSLDEHLYSDGRSSLDWSTRMKIALDAARGLEYLHELVNPPVIHRDFKTSNILLNDNFNAKVSDFGLAKLGSDKIFGQVSTRVLGTHGYVAPEYALTGHLTTKSDVYSFGVVLLELLTGRVPVDMKRPPGQGVLVSWALPHLTDRDKVGGMIDPSLEGQYTMKELIQVAAIAAMCVQPEADYRPLMTDVVQSLVPLVKQRSPLQTTSTLSNHPHL